jgi:NAD(P)-dependent dehydrogenase (short-subunit alcohol dehydrogenase family)
MANVVMARGDAGIVEQDDLALPGEPVRHRRVRVVHRAGEMDTGMLTRFTGTAENKAALVTEVPMSRLGFSVELANAIVFIASDEASFITVHILNVDGGHTAN